MSRLIAATVCLLACSAVLGSEQSEAQCLTKNVYWESSRAGEETISHRAVAWATINRVKDFSGRWGTNICDVVYQPSNNVLRPKACQYSWTCDGRPDTIPKYHSYLVREALAISMAILSGYDHYDPTFGATHYLRCDRKRSWTSNLEFKVKIGEHCFYGYPDSK